MNYLCDYHMHSTFSFDAKQTIKEAAEAAVKNNINEICFTEHVSFDSEDKSFNTFAFKDYSNEIEKTAQLYKGKLIIKKGIEAGEYYEHSEDFDNYYKENNLDFVIGSVHNIKRKGLRTNLRENGDDYSYKNYFEDVLTLARDGNFDVVGHLDLVQRYALNDFGIYDFHKYKDCIHEIIRILVERGKGIEVNTSGLLSHDLLLPRIEIIDMYKDLKGEIITVGSDSHTSDRVGENIKTAYELLKSKGFKYVFSFDKRKAKAIKLS